VTKHNKDVSLWPFGWDVILRSCLLWWKQMGVSFSFAAGSGPNQWSVPFPGVGPGQDWNPGPASIKPTLLEEVARCWLKLL
jgi:hypothetical protein